MSVRGSVGSHLGCSQGKFVGVTSPGRCEGDSLVIMPPARLAAGIALLAEATEHRIRAGADAAMGYPRFGMIDLLKLLGGLLVGVFR